MLLFPILVNAQTKWKGDFYRHGILGPESLSLQFQTANRFSFERSTCMASWVSRGNFEVIIDSLYFQFDSLSTGEGVFVLDSFKTDSAFSLIRIFSFNTNDEKVFSLLGFGKDSIENDFIEIPSDTSIYLIMVIMLF